MHPFSREDSGSIPRLRRAEFYDPMLHVHRVGKRRITKICLKKRKSKKERKLINRPPRLAHEPVEHHTSTPKVRGSRPGRITFLVEDGWMDGRTCGQKERQTERKLDRQGERKKKDRQTQTDTHKQTDR